MGAPIRTFICGLFAPGLGDWVVNKRQYGLATVVLTIATVLVFSWTRLVLEPLGFRAAMACLLAILFGSALHSAFVESRGVEGDRNWRNAVLFTIGVGVIFLLLFSFRGILLGYEAYRLPGQSMAPTLASGDQIVVDTWRYAGTEPANGDIVVFVAPDTGVTYVKRIVGVPKDVISLQGTQLIRNGENVNEPYAEYDGSDETVRPFSDVRVTAGHYFVLGDNRNRSKDSRFFGAVPRENLIGKVAITL